MSEATDTPKEEIEGFVTLHIPSKYSYLRIVRQSVMDICARAGSSEFMAAQLEMAVDEACANIIEHSYGGESGPSDPVSGQGLGLRVNLVQQADGILVELYDYGKGFNFESYQFPEPPEYIENQQKRGLGMFIINQFVDQVDYQRGTPEGNCLKLFKAVA